MGKYFLLQCKRQLRLVPGALLVTLILMGSLFFAFRLFTQQTAGQEENQKFRFAICGDTQDVFLQMGLSALNSFDSTRFALDVLEMEEEDAAKALARGGLAAYAVIPEGFMDAAMAGQILPIKFVTADGSSGMVSLVKEELSHVISVLLLSSQKGVYGMWDAMLENGLWEKAGGQMDRLALVYVDYIFARDRIYSLEELGIGDALGLEGYMLCGLGVLFSLLICLPFAALMIPGDPALGRLLCSRRKPALGQALCDFAAYAAGLTAIALILAILAALAVPEVSFSVFWQILPVVLLAAAFSYMLYSLSRDLISGVLLQFFLSVILCFVSGCLYPVYFFPVRVQRLAGWLPTGIARAQLADCITGSAPAWTLPALLGFGLVFLAVGSWARVRHIREVSP